MSLKKQMIIYFSCLMIGIFVLTELISGSQAYSLLEKNITLSIRESLGLGLKNMDYYFQDAGNICSSIIADNKAQKILNEEVEENLDGKILFRELNKVVTQYSSTAPYITKIYLINKKQQIMSLEVEGEDIEQITNIKYDENILNLSSIHQTSYMAGNTKVFSLVKPIYAYNNRENQLGTIVADLDYHIMDGLVKDFSLPMNGTVVLLDSQGQVFIKKNGEKIDWNSSDKYEGLFSNLGDKDTVTMDGKLYITLVRQSEVTGWKMFALIPKAEFIKSIFLQLRLTIILLLICLVIIVLVTRKIIFSIYRPLNLLMDSMSKIENGDFDTGITYEKKDEFSTLIKGYNIMVVKIKALLEEVVEKEKNRRTAELYALQAQINPHFLYNTLNSIRYFAKVYHAPEIRDMTTALIQLSKASLSSEKFITIGQEIELTQKYLTIQKMRYGDILQTAYHVEDELEQCMIPRFSIQPIVENALFHGILPVEHGHISITVSGKDKGILICVEDDGIGMSEEQITVLNESLKNNPVNHTGRDDISKLKNIGLENINYRIKIHFKDNESGLWITRRNPGTTVWLWIPEKINAELNGNRGNNI